MTLIELLMLMALLAVVGVLSIESGTENIDEQRFETTVGRMKKTREALVGDTSAKLGNARRSFGYLGDIGNIPSAGQGLAALISNPGLAAWAVNTSVRFGLGWNGPYLKSDDSGADFATDAWGTAFVYSPASTPPTLVSYGADGAAGGSGFDRDITLSLPDNVYRATVNGVILDSGAQWSGTAQAELNYPNGLGVLAQTLVDVNPADNGAFSFSSVPPGARSITIYIPSKAAATKTVGPVIVTIDRADTLHNFEVEP